MKIHIHCPGSLTEGLDSPCRGESRWTQNLVRTFAREGHQIMATGGGVPEWGSTSPEPNVALVPESLDKASLNAMGPFDISMDSAWWKDKAPAVDAKKYLILKWSMEDYTRNDPLPENQFLCYPLNMRSGQFFEDRCVNKDKTFFLPMPLGESFSAPQINKKGLLWTSKDIDREEKLRRNAKKMLNGVLYPTLAKDDSLFVVWSWFYMLSEQGLNPQTRYGKDVAISGLIPYYKMREHIELCRLVWAVNLPGSVHDAAILGVPTLEWSDGGFFTEIGAKHGVLIENDSTPEHIMSVVDKFLYDDVFYSEYVREIQNELRFNLNGEVVKYFNTIVEKIF